MKEYELSDELCFLCNNYMYKIADCFFMCECGASRMTPSKDVHYIIKGITYKTNIVVN